MITKTSVEVVSHEDDQLTIRVRVGRLIRWSNLAMMLDRLCQVDASLATELGGPNKTVPEETNPPLHLKSKVLLTLAVPLVRGFHLRHLWRRPLEIWQ